MAITDQQSPGRRQVQTFTVRGGLSASNADHMSKPVDFTILKDCLVDKRLGAVVKRPGSGTDTNLGTVAAIPLGMTDYTVGEPTNYLGITNVYLFKFGANEFRLRAQSNTYLTVPVNTTTCSFSASKQAQFAKIGSKVFIANGRPAVYYPQNGNYQKTIDRVGIEKPDAAPTTSSVAGSGGVTITQSAQYMFTKYNSTTGVESDWSDLSAEVSPVTSATITVTLPAQADTGNYDQFKIYRTLDGGTKPYLVATVARTTTTYDDTTSDARLTSPAADRYEYGLPPDSVYSIAAYANRVWMIDANNPYKIHFSKAYTGSDIDTEYFPIDNYLVTNEPATALFVTPGKMLVFHPRSISYISGYTEDDFVFQTFLPGKGTFFPNSIASDGEDITFLAEEGMIAMNMRGGAPRYISREIDLELQSLLAGSYNESMYVSAAYNTSLRQFIYMINCKSNASPVWESVVDGSVDTWQDASSLLDDVWEFSTGDTTTQNRIKIWGWSPELSGEGANVWMEYTFPVIADLNTDDAYPTFLFFPKPSSDVINPQQDRMYMGVWDGSEARLRTIFRKDLATDSTDTSSTAIVSKLMTGRLVPGADDGTYKLFRSLGFDNSYADVTSSGTATLQYVIDFDDPQLNNFTGSLVTISDTTDLKKMPSMLGRFIHLYITDSSASLTKILLSKFHIHYHPRMRREGR